EKGPKGGVYFLNAHLHRGLCRAGAIVTSQRKMRAGSDKLLIPEAELLLQAADWLDGRVLDPSGLRQAAKQRGLDFATAVLYQALRQSPRHGPLIALLDQPARRTPVLGAEIVIVPGAFYMEYPETGAYGRIIKESARHLNYATVTVPLQSF